MIPVTLKLSNRDDLTVNDNDGNFDFYVTSLCHPLKYNNFPPAEVLRIICFTNIKICC